MGVPLDIVVTCTDRKSAPVSPDARLRNLPSGPAGVLDAMGWRRLLDAAPRKHAARELYQGEAWAASLDLEAVARRVRGDNDVRLWVLSAGYGIVSADTALSPYAATFSAASPDFVGRTTRDGDATEQAQRWWEALCRTNEHPPGSLSQLGAQSSGDLLIVLSSAYLKACRPDVIQAVAANPRALVLAPSAASSLRLQHAAPHFDSRLLTTQQDRTRGIRRPISRGTRMSLNVRVAKLLVERFGEGPIDRADARTFLSELTERQPPLRRYEGEVLDDVAVRSFIREALHADPGATKSRLLRAFRDAGNKCEQKRFGRLFELATFDKCTKESA